MPRIKIWICNYWPLIVIFLYSLIPLSWFKNGYLLAGGDEIAYLNPGTNFGSYLFAWFDKFNAGGPNNSLYSIFPLKFFWLFLQFFGFSNLLIEKLWVTLLFILPGVSMYFLTSFLFRGYKKIETNIASLVSSTFYIFNIFVALNPIQHNTRLVLFGLPLCLLFWIKALNSENFNFRYPIYIGIISIFISSANANLPLTVLIPLSCFLYLLFVLFFKKKELLHLLGYSFLTVFFYFLFNLWWIVNLYFVQQTEIGSGVKNLLQQANFLTASPIWETFRLMGYWAFRGSYDGKQNVTYALNYYQQPLLTFTFLLLIFLFLPIFFKSKRKDVLFFVFLAVFGVFLAKGTLSPFSQIYDFLLKNIPYFWIFRDPFTKFTPLSLLAYAVLFGFTALYFISNRWTKSFRIFMITFFFLLIFSTAYPLVRGEVFDQRSIGSSRSIYVDVPAYWNELSLWLRKNDPNSRVFNLPKAGYGLSYNWKSGISGATYASASLLPNPQMSYVHQSNLGADRAISSLHSAILNSNKDDLSRALWAFNIKYVLHQGDISSTEGLYFKSISYKNLQSILSQKEGLVKIESFGPLDLYEISQFKDTQVFANSFFRFSYNQETLFEQLLKPENDALPLLYFVLSDNSTNQTQQLLSLTPQDVISPLGFSGLKPCSFCLEKVGTSFRYLLTGISRQDELMSEIKSAGAREVLIEEELGGGKVVSALFPNPSVKSVSVSSLWEFVSKLDEGSIFETMLPEEFPEYLVSDKNKGRYFLAMHDGNFMKMNLLNEPLAGLDEAGVGSVTARRLAVSVQGKKVGGEYKVVYLDSLPEDPIFSNQKKNELAALASPLINFKKIDPTQYKVSVKNVTQPFFLTLLESYSPFWGAQIERNGIEKAVSADNHLVSFGYANSWFIDQEGDFEMKLFYRPQKYVSISFLISFISLLVSVCLLFIFKRKGEHHVAEEEIVPKGFFNSILLIASRILFVGFIIELVRIVLEVSKGNEGIAEKLGSIAFEFLALAVFLNMLLLVKSKYESSKN